MAGCKGGGVCWRNTDLGVIRPWFKTQLCSFLTGDPGWSLNLHELQLPNLQNEDNNHCTAASPGLLWGSNETQIVNSAVKDWTNVWNSCYPCYNIPFSLSLWRPSSLPGTVPSYSPFQVSGTVSDSVFIPLCLKGLYNHCLHMPFHLLYQFVLLFILQTFAECLVCLRQCATCSG